MQQAAGGPESRQEPRQASAFAVLAVSTILGTLGAAGVASLAVLGPLLVADLGLTAADIGVFVGSTNVGALPGLIGGAAVVRRLGPGRAMAASSLVAAAGLVAFIPLAALGRVPAIAALLLYGTAWGVASVCGGGAVIEAAPANRRVLWSSVRTMGLPAGGVIAGLLASLASQWGWQGVIAVQAAAFTLLALAAFPLRVQRDAAAPGRPRTERPSRPLRIGALSVALSTAQWAFVAYLTIELTGRFGVDYGLAAGLFLVSQFLGVLARAGVGLLSDRLGPPRTALLARFSWLCCGCLLLFGLLGAAVPGPVLVAAVLLASVVIMSWNGIVTVAFAEAGPRHALNESIGTGLTAMRVGNIVGPPAVGALLAWVGSAGAWSAVAVLLAAAAAGFHRLATPKGTDQARRD